MGRRLAGRAVTLAAAMRDETQSDAAIDLVEPADEQTPEHVGAAARDALDRGETHYTAGSGIFELRRVLAERSTAEGFSATADAVVVTNGGSEALYIALQSVLAEGDHLLVAGPVAPNIVQMTAFIGAIPVYIPVRAADRFVPSVDALTSLGPTPRAILLASPSPVTGVAISNDVLLGLIAAADERGILVILDRSLAWCTFESTSEPFNNAALGARVLTVGSFSTAFAMSGWRVGYLSAPEGFIGEMRELKTAMSICTSAVSQYAALAALTGSEDWLKDRRASFVARRDLALGLLNDTGMDAIVPDAWPSVLLDTRLMHPDDRQAASMIARDTGVRVEPASRYGPSTAGYTRISLAADEAVLRDGLQRIGAFHSTCG